MCYCGWCAGVLHIQGGVARCYVQKEQGDNVVAEKMESIVAVSVGGVGEHYYIMECC